MFVQVTRFEKIPLLSAIPVISSFIVEKFYLLLKNKQYLQINNHNPVLKLAQLKNGVSLASIIIAIHRLKQSANKAH